MGDSELLNGKGLNRLTYCTSLKILVLTVEGAPREYPRIYAFTSRYVLVQDVSRQTNNQSIAITVM